MFLSGREGGILDLLYLVAQKVDPALLLALVCDHRIQLPLYFDKSPVYAVIFLIDRLILSVIIQDTLMISRIQQPYRIMLTIQIDQTAA